MLLFPKCLVKVQVMTQPHKKRTDKRQAAKAAPCINKQTPCFLAKAKSPIGAIKLLYHISPGNYQLCVCKWDETCEGNNLSLLAWASHGRVYANETCKGNNLSLLAWASHGRVYANKTCIINVSKKLAWASHGRVYANETCKGNVSDIAGLG